MIDHFLTIPAIRRRARSRFAITDHHITGVPYLGKTRGYYGGVCPPFFNDSQFSIFLEWVFYAYKFFSFDWGSIVDVSIGVVERWVAI